MKLAVDWKEIKRRWMSRGLLPGLLILSAAFSFAVLLHRFVAEERPGPLAIVVEMGSFEALKALSEAPEALEELKAIGVAEVAFYPRTIGQMEQEGLLTIRRGSEIIDLFRVEGIANRFMWEQIRAKPIDPRKTYLFVNDLNLFDSLKRDLYTRLGDQRVKAFSDGRVNYGGEIPNNYVLEVALTPEEARSAAFGPNETILARLQDHLLGAHLIIERGALLPQETIEFLRGFSSQENITGVEIRGEAEAMAVLGDPKLKVLWREKRIPLYVPPAAREFLPAGTIRIRPLPVAPSLSEQELFDRLYESRANTLLFRPEAPPSVQWGRDLSRSKTFLDLLRGTGHSLEPLSRERFPRWPLLLGYLFLLLLIAIPLGFVREWTSLTERELFSVYAVLGITVGILAVAGKQILLFKVFIILFLMVGPLWGISRWMRRSAVDGLDEEEGDIRQELAEALTVLAFTLLCGLAVVGLTDVRFLEPGGLFPGQRFLLYLVPGLILAAERLRFGGRLARIGEVLVQRLKVWHLVLAVGFLLLLQTEIRLLFFGAAESFWNVLTSAGAATGLTPRTLLILFGNAALIVMVGRGRESIVTEGETLWPLAAFCGQAATLDALIDPSRSLLGNLLEGLLLTSLPYISVFIYVMIQEQRGLLPELEEDEDTDRSTGDHTPKS